MSPKQPKMPGRDGREAAKPLTSGLSGDATTSVAGSRSGSASQAASTLDLRQRVNHIYGVLELILHDLKKDDVLLELQSVRRRGFQRGR